MRFTPTRLVRAVLIRALRAAASAHARARAAAEEAAFREEFSAFEKLSTAAAPRRCPLSWEDRYPCLADRTPSIGFDHHYIYHTAWAARVLARTRPAVHVDISSYLYFATLVSAFIPVKFYDYRPADVRLSNLTAGAADLTSLPFEDGSVESLSCMHVVEHIGLGRYGDSLDPNGDLKAVAELRRVLAPSGTLLFVAPVGKPRVAFNAHRIYSYEQIESYFQGLELKEFALIPDNPQEGGLIYGATRQMAESQSYGCGCFWFSREGV